MAEDAGKERDDLRFKNRHSASQQSATYYVDQAEIGERDASLTGPTALVEGRLEGRGSAPLRAAAIQGLQRTCGNRAVQRFLHSATSDEEPKRKPKVMVSRFEWQDALDTAAGAADWLNPLAMPAKAATRISGYATEQSQQNPDAGVMDILRGTFNAERQHERQSAASVKQAERTFGRGVEWAEGQVSGGAHWLADQVQGIPGLGDSANRGAQTVSDYAQIGTGVVKGAGTLVGGIAQMVANPIDTVAGLGALAEHAPTAALGIPNPFKMAHAAYDVVANDKPLGAAANSVFNPIESQRQDSEFFMNMGRGLLEPYGEALGRGRIGEVVGRGAFDIGSLFIGAGEARGAAEVGQVARGIEGAEAAAAAARGIEGGGAARVAQGAEALRVAEGLEGARGAAAAESGLMHKPIPTGGAVPAPIEYAPVKEVPAPVTLASPAPVKLSGPAPVELPPAVPTASPVPSGPFGLDETTEVIRRGGETGGVGSAVADDMAATIPDAAPVKEVPAPVELGPAPGGGSKPASLIDKALDAFKKLIGGDTKIKDAPGEVTIPKELNKGLQDAWDKSLPGGKSQEQGGILVQNADGSFQWKEAPPGKSGSIRLNYGDVEPGQSIAGSGHTHPYSAAEGGHTDIGFSSKDVSNLVTRDDPFKMVQSGDRQFASVKTEEFNAKVKDLDDAGKQAMQAEMNNRWNEVYNEAKAKGLSMEERVRAANQAVHSEYDLLYYEGQGGTLKQN